MKAKMENVRFESASEFVDFIHDVGKRAWVCADDPWTMTLIAVDENLEYVLELGMVDYKRSSHLLSAEEQVILESGKNYWALGGVELSRHQKYLLSLENMQGMANFIRKDLKKELDQSQLRIKGKVEMLPNGAMSWYDSDTKGGFYYIDGTGESVEEVGVTRVMLPYIEVGHISLKECDTIWDFSVDDFFQENEFLYTENRFYEMIKEKAEEDKMIIVPIRTDLTVLPVTNWVEGKIGFNAFEVICVGSPK